MKMLMCGLAVSFGALATTVQAELNVNVNGEAVSVSALMDNCKSMTDEPEAQVACFSAISQLLDKQSGEAEASSSVTDALDKLRGVAQYEDGETGLMIEGSGCQVQITYFANYFHISRRNVSSIDLYHASFDAANLQYDATAAAGGNGPLSVGVMDTGVTAAMRGGPALESSQMNFAPKSARTAMNDYAGEVASQLPPREAERFDFVLVHPMRTSASADIWQAFEEFVTACKS